MKKANIHEPDGRKAQIYAGRCSCSPVKVDPLFVFAFRQNIFFCPAHEENITPLSEKRREKQFSVFSVVPGFVDRARHVKISPQLQDSRTV